MSPDQFRRLALEVPGAVESFHQNHPDFRLGAGGKVFASLGHPDERHGMVKLTPEQQRDCIALAPAVFLPSAGAWGRNGYTNVRLEAADISDGLLREALDLAAKNVSASTKTKPRPKKSD